VDIFKHALLPPESNVLGIDAYSMIEVNRIDYQPRA